LSADGGATFAQKLRATRYMVRFIRVYARLSRPPEAAFFGHFGHFGHFWTFLDIFGYFAQ
jgi:hypothetical protein